MLIFWKQRLVFLAVPKTGTTAYEHALRGHAAISVLDPPELKHAPLYRYNRFFRPMLAKMGAESMDVLAVVREPISWLDSWYRYRQRPFLDGQPTSTKDMTFDTFVDSYMKGDRPPFANVGSQAKFLEPRPNGVGVTHLFRYEDQTALRAFLEARLSLSITLEQRNASGGLAGHLSEKNEARLRRKFRDDFDLWKTAACNGAVPNSDQFHL